MSGLKDALLEDPTYIYVTLAIAAVAAAAVWYRRRTRGPLIVLAAVCGSAGIVYAVEALVVTDRERIVAATEQIARRVPTEAPAVLQRYLTDDFAGEFRGRRIDKARAIQAARENVGAYGISEVRISRVEVRLSGRFADVEVGTLIVPEGRRPVPVQWSLSWVKLEEGWRIRSLKDYRIGLSFPQRESPRP